MHFQISLPSYLYPLINCFQSHASSFVVSCETLGILGAGSFNGNFGGLPVSFACSMAFCIFFTGGFLPFLRKRFFTALTAPLARFFSPLKINLLSELLAIMPRKLRTSASCGSVKRKKNSTSSVYTKKTLRIHCLIFRSYSCNSKDLSNEINRDWIPGSKSLQTNGKNTY